MSETTLRDTIETHANENGHSLSALTVMSNLTDPYRIDTPANRRDAEWLARAWEASGARRPLHLRGVHYALISTPTIAPMPDGARYLNTTDCWIWLQSIANRARWLGIIPFEDINDERNAAPQIYTLGEDGMDACFRVKDNGGTLWMPETVRTMLPEVGIERRRIRQAYRLVFIGEKQSLADVLLPIAQNYHAELVLPTGELSTTLLYGIAKRAAADGRPCRIFYLSDFDPTGYHMPIVESRKLQAMVEAFFPNLDVQLRRFALTAEQVKALGLPSTPMKETERRADRWRERFGVEQTEIDALATLRPLELRRIVRKAIAPYWDGNLHERANAAAAAAHEEALEARAAVIDQYRDRLDAAEGILEQARAAAALAEAEIEPLLSEIAAEVETVVDEIEIEEPEPEPDGDVDEPLFCSGREWVDQTEILRQEKL